MANLIVSVIAIALVAAMVLAATYYGGSVFSSYGVRADAGRMLSEGEQIAGAVNYYYATTNQVPTSLTTLVETEYLSDAPRETNWRFSPQAVKTEVGTGVQALNTCLAARQARGIDAEANCADAAAAGCSPSASAAPTGCNTHCLRTCYDPSEAAPRAAFNPQMRNEDPCCVNNSGEMIADPVFP